MVLRIGHNTSVWSIDTPLGLSLLLRDGGLEGLELESRCDAMNLQLFLMLTACKTAGRYAPPPGQAA